MKPNPELWRELFRANTTRIGFKLILTQPMLEFLSAVAAGCEWDRARYGSITIPDNFLATEHALTRRGLIVRKPPRVRRRDLENDVRNQYCDLTPAGKAVVAMLKAGGLFIEPLAAVERMKKRKGRW